MKTNTGPALSGGHRRDWRAVVARVLDQLDPREGQDWEKDVAIAAGDR